MAFGDWTEVAETFAMAVNHKQYGELSRKMLALVETIKDQFSPDLAIPGTSLLTLFFALPNVSTRKDVIWDGRAVYVIWQSDDIFKVWLEHREKDAVDEKYVPSAEVVPTVKSYLRQLRKL